ncbi:putative fatty acyl-CoA reductase CG5065 [Leptinotarsa decemlineata]|uniref:putative fatty acyl-CoA reductase CG5065 n=2 Tax=Leptinotarsa decemlineata TaxID=7539 RepID=UPI003D308A22
MTSNSVYILNNRNWVYEKNNDFNNNCELDTTTNNIGDFYRNSNIFVTGGTGFVGKALIEKLLRTCSDLNQIYLLMRPKKGLAVQERLRELWNNPVFNKVREHNPDALKKLKPVSGDISLQNLGMGTTELSLILEQTNIVFHSAATVKFNEDLKNAIIYNSLGTRRVLEVCAKMQQLKSFVYVSTAFSNADKENIEEFVYEFPYNPDSLINCIDILPKGAIDILLKKVLGKHPNTYTLTKAMAEQIVQKSSDTIPSAIVRPSIITAAWKEPYPGWVDSVSGITGIFMECGRGTIKSIICEEKYKIDVIPVDIVVNTLITAAWHTVAMRSNTMRVYNCTSGRTNPLTWIEMKKFTEKYSIEYPSKYVTWYPGFTYRTNRTMHIFYATLFHFIPSAILDIYLYTTGQKPIMLKISRKFHEALQAGSFFSTNQWNFEVSTMQTLQNAIDTAKDGGEFEINISESNGFSWDQYIKNFMIGVRQYVLKDDISSLAQARAKLYRLFWFQKIVQTISLYTITRLISYCFSKII